MSDYTSSSSSILHLTKGDITSQKVDVIVNAANSSLLGGGGVDGAIHHAGGPSIVEECWAIVKKQGPLPAGGAVLTKAGRLPCRYIIHTVGPVWHGGSQSEAKTLAACYTNSLGLAAEHSLHSLAFPNISTGIYGFPKQKAAETSVNAIKAYLSSQTSTTLEQIILVCFDQENYEILHEILKA